jgi:hypothetical protein
VKRNYAPYNFLSTVYRPCGACVRKYDVYWDDHIDFILHQGHRLGKGHEGKEDDGKEEAGHEDLMGGERNRREPSKEGERRALGWHLISYCTTLDQNINYATVAHLPGFLISADQLISVVQIFRSSVCIRLINTDQLLEI